MENKYIKLKKKKKTKKNKKQINIVLPWISSIVDQIFPERREQQAQKSLGMKKNARKQLWCGKWRQNSLRATALFPSAQILNRACITRDEHIKPCWVVFIVQHQEGFGVKAQMLRSSEGISRHCHRNFMSLWHYLSSAHRSVGSTQHSPFVQTAHKLSKDCVLTMCLHHLCLEWFLSSPGTLGVRIPPEIKIIAGGGALLTAFTYPLPITEVQ